MAYRRDEQGAVAIMVAVLAVSLFIVAALVVDIGLARDTRGQAQNAADASALAAANALYPSGACISGTARPCVTDAVNAAKSYAANNYGVGAADWATCPPAPSTYVVATGSPTCISFDTLPKPKKVFVVMPTRDVDTSLGAFAGVSTIKVSAQARAALVRDVMGSCSLCFLGNVDAGNGSTEVSDALDSTEVTNGRVMVNGWLNAVNPGGWTAEGGISVVDTAGTNVPGVTQIEPFTDPWATRTDLPPSTAGLPNYVTTSPAPNPCSNGPGIYGAYTFKDSCNLSPGLYVLTGEWTVNNTAKLSGSNITIYAKSPTGYFNGKNGEVDLRAGATTVNGSIPDVAVVYDRDNHQNFSIQGNGGNKIEGGVYIPGAKIDLNGGSTFTFKGGPVIAYGVVKLNGHSSLKLDASTSANAISDTGGLALDQ